MGSKADISHVFFWQSSRSRNCKHITQTGSVTFCIYINTDHHNIRPFFITTHQQHMPLALNSLYIPVFTCNAFFQELKILADFFFFLADFSSFICHYPPKEGQRSILQTCLLYLLLYWGTVVNDQALLTIYLFGIASSMAVHALWQLSCTPSPQVLLRDNDEKFLAKGRNTNYHKLWHLLCHLLMFFLASNRKKIAQELCSYCKAYLPVKERGYSLLEAAGTSNHKLTFIW